MLTPPGKAHMCRGKGAGGGSLPREVALGPIGAEGDNRASITIAGALGFFLARIPNIEDAYRPDEIELWSTDVDIRPILDETQCKLCRGKSVRNSVKGKTGRFRNRAG